MPAPFKKQLSEAIQEGFVLKRAVSQSCLELYPMKEWNVLDKKLKSLNRFVQKNLDFIRLFQAGLKVVEIDSLGRILVPKDLLNFSSISKDVVLSTSGNCIEIWDKEAYEKVINATVPNFASLAEEVMGNLNFDEDGIS